MDQQKVVLYDGVCHLCTAVVRFAIVRDRSGTIRFAALQSDAGTRLLADHGLTGNGGDGAAPDTFVWIEGGRAYTRSTAALRLLRHLRGLWPVLSLLLLVPRWLRDPLYRYVAANRYRWFGRHESCMMMKPEYRDRFLT